MGCLERVLRSARPPAAATSRPLGAGTRARVRHPLVGGRAANARRRALRAGDGSRSRSARRADDAQRRSGGARFASSRPLPAPTTPNRANALVEHDEQRSRAPLCVTRGAVEQVKEEFPCYICSHLTAELAGEGVLREVERQDIVEQRREALQLDILARKLQDVLLSLATVWNRCSVEQV